MSWTDLIWEKSIDNPANKNDCPECGVGLPAHDPRCKLASPTAPTRVIRADPPPYVSPATPPVITSGPIYGRLLDRTRFEDTDAGKVYAKYYAKLSRITDEGQRRATAIDLAASENVDRAAIVAAFDGLASRLQDESTNFSQASQARLQKECLDPGKRVAEIESQIAQLQQEKAKLEASIQPATDAIRAVEAQFDAAWKRRKQELDAEKASFIGG